MRLQHSLPPFSFYLTSHVSGSTHTRWQIAGQVSRQRPAMACSLVGECEQPQIQIQIQCPHLQHPPDVRHVVHVFVHVQVPPTRLHTGTQGPTQHRRLGEEWRKVAECGRMWQNVAIAIPEHEVLTRRCEHEFCASSNFRILAALFRGREYLPPKQPSRSSEFSSPHSSYRTV